MSRRNILLFVVALFFFFLPLKSFGEITSVGCLNARPGMEMVLAWGCYFWRLITGLIVLPFLIPSTEYELLLTYYSVLGVGIVLIVLILKYANTKNWTKSIKSPAWLAPWLGWVGEGSHAYWVILGILLALEMFFWLISQFQK